MRLYKRPPAWKKIRAFLPVICGLAVFGIAWAGLQETSGTVEEEQLRMTEASIRRAVVSCYAIEGSYPQNLEYLTENYGVQIDTRKYVVNYSIMGSNTMPYIEVIPRGGKSRLDGGFGE